MRASSKVALALTILAFPVVATEATAHKYWNSIGECYDPLEGAATGTGILGLGTARARESAIANWQAAAANKYGPAAADLSRAAGVRWDCKKNALVLAKCIVVAKPCTARLRG